MIQIITGSLILSLIHALIPNHWIPLIAVGKTEKWTRKQTLFATLITGFSHTASTILIGVGVGFLGIRLTQSYHGIVAFAAPAILVVLGIIYILLDVRSTRHHHHFELNENDISKKRSWTAVILSLSLAMFLTPCTEIEAYYFQAASRGWIGILMVSVVYVITTVVVMLFLVYFGSKGIMHLRSHFLEHHDKLMTGIVLIVLGLLAATTTDYAPSHLIKKGNVTYDFTFAELAINYLETNDTTILTKVAETGGARHILDHARKFNYDVPKTSALDLVKYLLTPIEEKRKILTMVKRNLMYARDSIAAMDLSQTECLKSLPTGFKYDPSTHLFFTFGYDLGVTINGNSSVNLAHPHYLADMHELRYYSIHELHHAGFLQLRNNRMADLNIHKYSEMAALIEFCTQLEGMGTFAPLALREKENAMNADKDYIALQDTSLMRQYEKEYFEIYYSFRDHPQETISDKDWEKISILSDQKRLWYRVGAMMAARIDKRSGREKLTELLKGPPENFILSSEAAK